jgi:hypothetical protein
VSAGRIDALKPILAGYFGTIYPQSGYDPGMRLLIAVLGTGTLALIGLHLWVVHMHAVFAAR